MPTVKDLIPRSMSLKDVFPNLKYPVLCPPMANVSGASLATSVSRAGGLGLIGGGYSSEKLQKDLRAAADAKRDCPSLQVGFGILTFTYKSQTIIHDMIRELKDSQVLNCIWLFGGSEEAWIPNLKKEFPKLKVIVQVHTVENAKKMVEAGADVIVAQGSDAGGHGGAECSSIISLVPEIIQACPSVPVLAAGGISNGRSMFAAMSLGAQGVVLGTRFMVSDESLLPQKAKEVACHAVDGGRTTVQTRIYDEMRGTTDWPMTYSGRAIRNKTVEELSSGRSQEELKQDYNTAMEAGDYSRVVCWAGTGVGLVNQILPASVIVENLIVEYNQAVREAPKSL